MRVFRDCVVCTGLKKNSDKIYRVENSWKSYRKVLVKILLNLIMFFFIFKQRVGVSKKSVEKMQLFPKNNSYFPTSGLGINCISISTIIPPSIYGIQQLITRCYSEPSCTWFEYLKTSFSKSCYFPKSLRAG